MQAASLAGRLTHHVHQIHPQLYLRGCILCQEKCWRRLVHVGQVIDECQQARPGQLSHDPCNYNRLLLLVSVPRDYEYVMQFPCLTTSVTLGDSNQTADLPHRQAQVWVLQVARGGVGATVRRT